MLTQTVSKTEEQTMKKTIVGSLLLAVLLAGAPAGAATTCICIGVANTKMCGGIGGSFLRVHRDVSASLFGRFLMTPAAKAEFDAAGQAFDVSTGWFCIK
jgi:hypothetical protein